MRNGGNAKSGNGHSPHPQPDRSRVPRLDTQSQVKAILAIARRQNTDLAGLLRQEYEVQSPQSPDHPAGKRAHRFAQKCRRGLIAGGSPAYLSSLRPTTEVREYPG